MNTLEKWWEYKPLTEQGSLKIAILIRDMYTKEIKGERLIPRAMLARLMFEGRVFADKGRFIVEF